MKNVLMLLFLIPQLVSCQVQYNDKYIFLGEYNDQEELKIYKNDSVYLLKENILEQTYQYKPNEFMQVLHENDLYFIAEGDEPYWSFKLNLFELCFEKYDSTKEEQFHIDIYVDKQSGFNLMFKSKDNRAFGLIRKINYKLQQENSCSLGLSDNYLIYEVFITIDGELFKGCSMIDL